MKNNKDYPLIIAGLGRCGTSLMYFGLRQQGLGDGSMIVKWEDADFKNGNIYKTHAPAPEDLPENAKVIFMFGNPMNSVLSVQSKFSGEFLEHHYRNLWADVSEHDKIFEKDTLKLEENFDSWYKEQNFQMMTLKYETMFNHLDEIREFIGWDAGFPPKRSRSTNYDNHPKKGQLDATYKSLSDKIDAADEVRVWNVKQKA